MIQALFQNTTIPALGESINFAQARHNVLVGNVANLDTPGYRALDLPLETFQEKLAEAIQARSEMRDAYVSEAWNGDLEDPWRQVRATSQSIVRHDGVNVGMEQQVLEISKNQFLHNLAITVMGSQFRLLQTMISEHL
jgi:flagellar basal-body rod protein FlgB